MSDHINRLMAKAEQAIDQGNIDQAAAYSQLAGQITWLRKREAKDIARMVNHAEAET